MQYGKHKLGRLRFTISDDVILLREVLAQNPFEDYRKWKNIQENIAVATNKPFTVRSVRDHLEHIVKLFRKNDQILVRRSGTEEQYQEKQILLNEVDDLEKEYCNKLSVPSSGTTKRCRTVEPEDQDENAKRLLKEEVWEPESITGDMSECFADESSNGSIIVDNGFQKAQTYIENKIPVQFENDSALGYTEEKANDLKVRAIELEERRAAVEERRLALEERKIAIEEQKIEMERQKLTVELQERTALANLVEQQQKIIACFIQKNKFN